MMLRPHALPMLRARHWAGCVVYDLPRWLPRLAGLRGGWRAVCNRSERLEAAPDHSGYRCLWRWSSPLHAAGLFPILGRALLRKALADHPISVQNAPAAASAPPEVSFIIGHRGRARLPLLQAVLRTIAAQRGARIECIVVEQDTEPSLQGELPGWVRIVHTPPPVPGMPYARAWAFNVGVRQARGPVLVLHDNDLLVPTDYAAYVLERVRQGYEVVNPKRFVFYLAQTHSAAVQRGQAKPGNGAPERVVQNLEAGGSVAITRSAFDAIGGMDESFVGWGGEDNEFWERAQTLRAWTWGALPLIHLWHEGQPGKHDPDYVTAQHYRELAQVDVRERIRRLLEAASGRLDGPAGWRQA